MENNLYNTIYNPDVLSCIANLSNDEVFTPPNIANAMLDLLPQELFSDPNATFLDPACKSGVFLREIAKRLLKGLEKKIPDLQERTNHIFKKQLFGIAITELTSHLSRRSVYCSKTANGNYSVVSFDTVDGNIRFKTLEHTWYKGRCKFCGASKDKYNRGSDLESHAYEFIHVVTPEEIFKMKFDVIVSNPPYQLGDGGGMGTAAMPIYNYFVEQAKKLNPRYLTMIIPSRWFSGGRGLDSFRSSMLHDKHIRVLHDFIDASLCFPGVEIKGGVCYFLRDRDNAGLCTIVSHLADGSSYESERPLLEDGLENFLRFPEQIAILKKVQKLHERSFSDIISANDPFGYDVREESSWKRVKPKFSLKNFKGAIAFYYNGWRRDGIGYVSRGSVRKGHGLINRFKILFPKAWGKGDSRTDRLHSFIVSPKSVCTETYLVVGPFKSFKQASNAQSYVKTKFFHFMVSMIKITQNTMKGAYAFVPLQDFNVAWTDEALYKKYKLTRKERDFIESSIQLSNSSDGEEDE